MKNIVFLILLSLLLNNCSGVTPYKNDVVFEDSRKNIQQFNFNERKKDTIKFNYNNNDLKQSKYETINFNNTTNFGNQKYVDINQNKNSGIDFDRVEIINFSNTEQIDFNKTEKYSFNDTEQIDFNKTENINFNDIEKNSIKNKLNNYEEYEIINIDKIMKREKEETTVVKSTLKESFEKLFNLIMKPGKFVADALYPTTIDVVNEHNEKKVKNYLGEQYDNKFDYELGRKVIYENEYETYE